MKKCKIAIPVLLAVALLIQPVMELSATGLSEAQEEKAALEKELEKAQELIDELKDSQENVEAKVQQLDTQLTEIEGRILSLEEELEQKNLQIEDTKQELLEAENEANEQYERMKYRIKYMYENSSSMSMLEALFTSGSIAEFINQVEYIRQISDYDRDMLEKYQQTRQIVATTKESLEEEYGQLEELKAQVQAEREAVDLLLAAKEEELSGIKGDLTEAEAEADAMAAEIQAQNEIIAQIKAVEAQKEKERKEAEERRKQEQQNGGENSGTEEPPEETYAGGEFVWPCPSSKRVTSDYGNRLSPTEGASSNHKGIDIGADYGASIVAAADGSVAYAGYNSGMGNYIMLSHGSGLYTVYGHCSALLVATGDEVTAGQTIAQIGSTGISTGNHLHFGVSKDGSYVSPWNYLSK